MALADHIALRSNFLQEAAHLLAVSSPSASAFLGSARCRLVEETGSAITAKEQEALRRAICGACGNLLIPGCLQLQPRRRLRGEQHSWSSKLVARNKTVNDDQKLPKTANASSKQRQKARKGGLQAMLEKNKNQSSSQGFDLMDFAM
ncbi:hypothetical protein EK21DRAFT_66224 [Setomelanomma holmii]|uniref:Uncharacterized protein n=1 Tax=Setomelanomma holmii TaxID=210430 RepID=A0A9P4H962_9PLEO|nr:hypothetical protein EK21DRAFT_66224 [Setomelanomma holmii]